MTPYATYPSLRERVVLVTGGGSGIGASIVGHFCAQSSRVAFRDIDRSASERLCGEIAAAGRAQALFLHCDLRDVTALRAAIADVRRRLGAIRVLVNNAAHDERHPLDAVTPEYSSQVRSPTPSSDSAALAASRAGFRGTAPVYFRGFARHAGHARYGPAEPPVAASHRGEDLPP